MDQLFSGFEWKKERYENRAINDFLLVQEQNFHIVCISVHHTYIVYMCAYSLCICIVKWTILSMQNSQFHFLMPLIVININTGH